MMNIRRLFNRWILNPKALVIADSMRQQPGAWAAPVYYRHGDDLCVVCNNGLDIWVGNGWWFVAIDEPQEEKLGLVGRTMVWRAVRPIMRRIKDARFEANEAEVQRLREAG